MPDLREINAALEQRSDLAWAAGRASAVRDQLLRRRRPEPATEIQQTARAILAASSDAAIRQLAAEPWQWDESEACWLCRHSSLRPSDDGRAVIVLEANGGGSVHWADGQARFASGTFA